MVMKRESKYEYILVFNSEVLVGKLKSPRIPRSKLISFPYLLVKCHDEETVLRLEWSEEIKRWKAFIVGDSLIKLRKSNLFKYEYGGRLAMRKILFTQKLPAEPGWYWYRSSNARLKVIEIVRWQGELYVSGKTNRRGSGRSLTYGSGAEWAGPLEPPR